MSKELKRKDASSLSLWNPDYTLEKSIVDFIKTKYSKKYGVILDFGCGNSPYRHLFSFDKYIQADIIQNETNTVELLIDNSMGVPLQLKDESVDLIICTDVLEHSGNFDNIVKDFYRILKPDGQLFISLPFLYREHEMPYDLYRYTSSFIRNKMGDFNFSVDEIKKIGGTYYVLYSLWLESVIKAGELVDTGLINKFLRKSFNKILLPFFNKYIFVKSVDLNDSVYHHILVNLFKR